MTPYMDGVVAARSVLLDEEEALEGSTLLSAETVAELEDETTATFVQEHFGDFLKHLRHLSKTDQDLLLSYFLLKKTQSSLGVIFGTTQTLCSQNIRMAVRRLGLYMMMGGEPSTEVMSEILTAAGWENALDKVSLSEVVCIYRETRSFKEIADRFGLHRPDIRRAMRQASTKLLESTEPREIALGAYIHGLIDKASPDGTGLTKRQQAKETRLLCRKDPDVVGQFRVRVDGPEFAHLFIGRANN